jgi:hypothetical protein
MPFPTMEVGVKSPVASRGLAGYPTNRRQRKRRGTRNRAFNLRA